MTKIGARRLNLKHTSTRTEKAFWYGRYRDAAQEWSAELINVKKDRTIIVRFDGPLHVNHNDEVAKSTPFDARATTSNHCASPLVLCEPHSRVGRGWMATLLCCSLLMQDTVAYYSPKRGGGSCLGKSLLERIATPAKGPNNKKQHRWLHVP